MSKNLSDYLAELPYEVEFADISDFNGFEERFFAISGFYGDILGMNIGSMEFCPNQNPPDLKTEILPFLWVINPHLKDEIRKFADDLLIQAMSEYDPLDDRY